VSRHPRTKSPAQLCSELDAILASGFRGTVFLSDDNLWATKWKPWRLLTVLRQWMEQHRFPFQFYSEASINLAASNELMDAMVRAGFRLCVRGHRDPVDRALRETHKAQNLAVDPARGRRQIGSPRGSTCRPVSSWASIRRTPPPSNASANGSQIRASRRPWWVSWAHCRNPVGAAPGSRGPHRWNALAAKTFGRANFRTKIGRVELLESYRRLLASLYAPAAYFERVRRVLELRPRSDSHFSLPWLYALRCVLSSMLHQGVLAVTAASIGASWGGFFGEPPNGWPVPSRSPFRAST